MIKTKLSMSGHYRITARKADGSSRVLADWFPNLITDNGLNLCTTQTSDWNSTNSIMYAVCVGSGSSAPNVSDTALDSLVATKLSPSPYDIGIDSGERFFWARATWSFAQGDAAGNLSEIGVGPANNNLFSRALILDSGGSPTTITVLADEFLDVTYELRVNQPVDDIIATVDGYDVVLRIGNVNTTGTFGWNDRPFVLIDSDNIQAVATGALGAITTLPSGLITADNDNIENSPYTPGTFTRMGTYTFQPSEANSTLNSAKFIFGPAVYQFSISPSITKNNTQRLTIGVSITWGREGELPS